MNTNSEMIEQAELILNTLDSATRLSWSIPPTQPSFLCNGYHATTSMALAPRTVRQLQSAAIHSTGRPRAILFEACGRGKAIINIPKEVAESDDFIYQMQHIDMEETDIGITLPNVIPYPQVSA